MCSVGMDEANKQLRESSDTGRYVHSYIESLINGGPKPSEIPERCKGLIASVDLFFKDYKTTPVLTEGKFTSLWGYAGTLDYVGRTDGKLELIDWKTSNAVREEYALQTAAYMVGYNENYQEKVSSRKVVRFKKDGSAPEVREYGRWEDPLDFHSFLGALQLFNSMYRKVGLGVVE